METTFKVLLCTIQDVKNFSYIASEFPRKCTVTAIHNDYRVDAKSILGLFSLNLSEPITIVVADTYGLEEKIARLKQWEVG